MFNKKSYDYFSMLVKLVDYSCQASGLLCEALDGFREDKLPQMLSNMHKIEHKADLEKHDMMARLAKEFITPIEREDIVALAHKIDDVTDSIEEALIKIYMYNVKELPKETKEFTQIISKSCTALKDAVTEFRHFRKSTAIHKLIIEVNCLEEECDRIYMTAMRKLFEACSSPIKLMAYSEIYECFESCCDACEDVSEGIEGVIMKNS